MLPLWNAVAMLQPSAGTWFPPAKAQARLAHSKEAVNVHPVYPVEMLFRRTAMRPHTITLGVLVVNYFLSPYV